LNVVANLADLAQFRRQKNMVHTIFDFADPQQVFTASAIKSVVAFKNIHAALHAPHGQIPTSVTGRDASRLPKHAWLEFDSVMIFLVSAWWISLGSKQLSRNMPVRTIGVTF